MPETDPELRISQLRQLIDRGEYQIDPARIAASLVDEHLAVSAAASDSTEQDSAEPLASANVAAS